MTEFSIRPTINRRDSRRDYIIRMSEEARRKHFGRQWPRMVVVSYEHPSLKAGYSWLKGIEISTIARLRSPHENPTAGENDIIEIDQALRRALGLPKVLDGSEKVTIAELRGVHIFPDLMPKVIGRRFANCRPTALHSQDVEQRIVRLKPDVLDLLGIKSGERVVLCGVKKCRDGTYYLKKHRVSALEASLAYLEKFKEFPALPDMHEKFAHVSKILYPDELARDLSPIYLDKDTRDQLFGPPDCQEARFVMDDDTTNTDRIDKTTRDLFLENVQYAQPVLIYRAPFNAITNEIMAIFFTAIALTFTLDQWLSKNLSDRLTLVQFFMVLLGSFTLATAVAALKTRNLR